MLCTCVNLHYLHSSLQIWSKFSPSCSKFAHHSYLPPDALPCASAKKSTHTRLHDPLTKYLDLRDIKSIIIMSCPHLKVVDRICRNDFEAEVGPRRQQYCDRHIRLWSSASRHILYPLVKLTLNDAFHILTCDCATVRQKPSGDSRAICSSVSLFAFAH